MAVLVFPSSPTNGELYPSSPLTGQNQYRWEASTLTWRLLGEATGVIPGCYGDDATIPTFCVDALGRITSAQNVPVSSGDGTVTSVAVSGGTTGLTASGGPITVAGTITLGGTLLLTNGGTGATTQSGAQANLLPAQATHANQFLKTNGAGVLSWGAVGTVTYIDVSGGTTGLTFSGSPVTSSGTVTMGGTLALTNGGTGATTKAGAQANLLPAQTAPDAGQFLKTDGAGVLSWGNPGVFPAGTRMTFQQSAAPTGWVKDTAYNNYAMRIVNGSVGTGGTVGFTTAFASGLSSAGHSLTISEMATHNHAVNDLGHRHNLPFPVIRNMFSMLGGDGTTPILTGDSAIAGVDSSVTGITIQNNGAGTAHSHSLPSFDVQYVDFIIATKS